MIQSDQTLPKLLAEKAKANKNDIALRQKDLGIWREVTWGEYYRNVELLAISLSENYNFKQEETLVVIGENRPQWLYAQMATQVLGGISVGVYQESLAEQLVYYLNDCKARIIIVEDQEQVDKLLEIEDQIPLVEHIIYYINQGMRHYEHPKLIDFGELLLTGEKLLKEQKDFFRDRTERSLGNEIAIIAYSAATTGKPRGAMLTHSNLISAAKNLESIDEIEVKDDYLSFLPLAWIHEQIMSIVIPLTKGMVVNFPERPSTVLSDLHEIGPHTLLAPPRVYQTLMSNFMTRIEGASWFKRKVYQGFKKYGDKVAKQKLDKQPISSWDNFMFKLGDFLVFSAIRDHFGLSRLKRAYIAGAAISSETFYFYHSIGVNLKQTYGGTEVTGIAFVQRDDDIQIRSSGVPISNTEVKVAEDGSILVKNLAIFANYLNELDRGEVVDGWLSLGDIGFLDESGHLHILDRQEDVITADNEEVIYPSAVENKLKVSPYIQEALTIGKDRPYMTAILNIDMTSMGRWADRNNIVYTAYSDLSRVAEVRALVKEEVIRLMKGLPNHARIKKFVILDKQFNANDGELTRTLKVRRRFIQDKYHELIEGIYSDAEEIKVEDSAHESIDGVGLKVIEIDTNQDQGVA